MNRLWVRLSLAIAALLVFVTLALPLAGATVGRFAFRRPNLPPRRFPAEPIAEQRERALENQLRVLLIVTGLGGLLGIGVAVYLSRSLTAPLETLVRGAQAIGARDLNHRVPVEGSDEIQEVAHAFNAMAAALQEAETLRRNLLADVAHELRTPLTVLEGNLRALLDDVYALDKAEVVRLYDQTRHLHRLVDDLRLLAQAEARQLPLDRQPVDLATLAAETADLFRPLAAEKAITLALASPDQPVTVRADRARIAQALQNLLSNALRHTPAGGEVTVHVHTGNGEAEVAITDTGDGITPEDLPHVFDRFYRTHKARSRDTGGAGLGLAIVRALVEAHDGSVTAESEGPGRGSRFTVRLPRAS